MTALPWPRRGRCGACGRLALGYPSGRWTHVGRPCRARSRTLWTVDDLHIRAACVFVPEGQALPVEPNRYRMDSTDRPGEFAVTRADRLGTVREFLASEAEEGRRDD